MMKPRLKADWGSGDKSTFPTTTVPEMRGTLRPIGNEVIPALTHSVCRRRFALSRAKNLGIRFRIGQTEIVLVVQERVQVVEVSWWANSAARKAVFAASTSSPLR